MTERERYAVYTAQRGSNWTPKQITRLRKKLNQQRKRSAELDGRTYHLRKRSNGNKSGFTNYDLRNPA